MILVYGARRLDVILNDLVIPLYDTLITANMNISSNTILLYTNNPAHAFSISLISTRIGPTKSKNARDARHLAAVTTGWAAEIYISQTVNSKQ